ncbi:kinesin motor domain protein [Pelomyxa schiedti]|nr:kinesin motor domain protein [Pelomyxa schiedti]
MFFTLTNATRSAELVVHDVEAVTYDTAHLGPCRLSLWAMVPAADGETLPTAEQVNDGSRWTLLCSRDFEHRSMHQGTEDTVRVFVRLRPLLHDEGSDLAWSVGLKQNGKGGYVQQTTDLAALASNLPTTSAAATEVGNKRYDFNHVFGPKASNIEVYNVAVRPVVRYTIFGNTTEGVEGVIYTAIEEIFAFFASHSQDSKFLLCVSFLEVYNEEVYDLLDSSVIPSPLHLRERNGNFFVESVQEIFVSSSEEVLDLLNLGNTRKVMGSSYLHNSSSRSHTIFRLILAREELSNSAATVSELNLVDLAGSESLCYTHGDAQQQETKHINVSLTCLKDVITALSRKEQFIPYRNSLLTKLLQHSLGRDCLTAMVCCISPSFSNRNWSKRTLQFGEIAKKVVNIPKVIIHCLGGGTEEAYLKPQEEVD